MTERKSLHASTKGNEIGHGNDRAAWFQANTASCPQPRQATDFAFRLILLGAPGAGKGTQAYLLSQRLKTCHLSTGDLFRAASRQNECDQSPAMRAATEHMRNGELVPDAIVWEMVRERADCLQCAGGFVLDGFPRTFPQAESLKELLEEEKIPLTAVVSYELPLDEIVSRLSGRRTCERCKAVFHVTGQPPIVSGVCDRCGGHLCQREDDRPESIIVRMAAYEVSTAPLIEFYKNLDLLVPVVATGTPDEICTRTIAAIMARTRVKRTV